MQADASIVEAWINGWALARETSLPVRKGSGFRIDVGWPQQKVRYVFPNLTEEFDELANKIAEPWVFLKVCADPEEVRRRLPLQWVIQPAGFMMTYVRPMQKANIHRAGTYVLEINDDIPVPVVKVLSQGEIVSIGRIAFAGDYAIYDRVETHPLHRRKKLATIVMKALEQIALSRGIAKGVLVATAEGKVLYEALGWDLYSVYTSAVIPESA